MRPFENANNAARPLSNEPALPFMQSPILVVANESRIQQVLVKLQSGGEERHWHRTEIALRRTLHAKTKEAIDWRLLWLR